MDIRGFDRAHGERESDPTEGGVGEAAVPVGTDERRMHVRAYNHWVSLLGGREFPPILALDPSRIADFGPHSVLLDFTGNAEDPAISFLGEALREECALDHSIAHISEVPARSLLSRLTDHSHQIIANRAPIGFEAEFVSTRGHNTMYRGILLPFSSDGATIDFIYGVINWKEIVGEAEQAQLTEELAAAVRSAPKIEPPAAVWADGPSAAFGGEDDASFAAEAEGDDRTPLATLSLDVAASPGDIVVLVARASENGRFDVLGAVTDDPVLIDQAAARIG